MHIFAIRLLQSVAIDWHHTPGYPPPDVGILKLRSHPHLRLRSNPPIICSWRKQINPGGRALRDSGSFCGASPTACRYSMGSTKRRRNWRGSTASTASRTGRVTKSRPNSPLGQVA